MALTKAHNRMIADAAVNVKDFGAVGDGTTDDTSAIQAAIDVWKVAQGESDSGSFLLFPSGRYKITSTLDITFSENAVSGGIKFEGARLISQISSGAVLQIKVSSSLARNFFIDDLYITCGGNEDQALLVEAGTTGATSIYRFEIFRPRIESVPGGAKGIVIAENAFEMVIHQPNIGFSGGSTASGGYGIHLTQTGGGNVSSVDIYGGTISGGEYNLLDNTGGVKIYGGTFLESGSYNVLIGDVVSSVESSLIGCHFENGQLDSADTSLVRIDGIGSIVGCYGTASQGGANTLLRCFPAGRGVSAYGLAVTGNITKSIENKQGTTGGQVFTDAKPSEIVATRAQEERLCTARNEGVYRIASATGTITMNMDFGNTLHATLTGNITLAAPSNPQEGQELTVSLVQDATGSRSITFDAVFNTQTTPSTTASERTTYKFVHLENAWFEVAATIHT